MKEFIIEKGRRKYKFTCEKCNSTYFRRIDTAKNNSTMCINCTRKSKAPKKHGDCGTKLYLHWANMKNRCYGIATQKNRDYKAKGIIVCKEWKDSYENFKDWSLKNGYNSDLTLDRKDNNGIYEPENCRWITNIEQQSNKREIIKSNTSGFKNISFNKKSKKWRLSIKKYNLKIDKLFNTLDDAIKFKENILKGNK